MGIHSTLAQSREAKAVIPDPGNGQYIKMTKNGQCLVRTTAGSGTETRKIARPLSLNQELMIVFAARTVDCEIRPDGGLDVPGIGVLTGITFASAATNFQDFAMLKVIQLSTGKVWAVVSSQGGPF